MVLHLTLLIFLILLTWYVVKVVRYTLALRTLHNNKNVLLSTEEGRKVTMIIPVRNERPDLPSLYNDLLHQDYPDKLSQILFVDDHSSDGTADFLKNIASKHSNYLYLSLPEGIVGKKAAIDYGVSHASGDWIIQTDADCRLPRSFIKVHVTASLDPDTVLVAGIVKYLPSSGFFEQMERLEYYSLVGVTMGSMAIKKPVMCNAANMSYSKDFYSHTAGKLQTKCHPSGDDIFLLESALREKKKIHFLHGINTIVSTRGKGNFRDFINQRIRWGSKAKFYKNPEMIFVTILFWIINLNLSLMIIFAIFHPVLLTWTGAFWMIKTMADSMLLYAVVRYFDQRSLMWYFPIAAIFYHFYLAVTGIISSLAGFSWKERLYG